jgi:hypothetical protein
LDASVFDPSQMNQDPREASEGELDKSLARLVVPLDRGRAGPMLAWVEEGYRRSASSRCPKFPAASTRSCVLAI